MSDKKHTIHSKHHALLIEYQYPSYDDIISLIDTYFKNYEYTIVREEVFKIEHARSIHSLSRIKPYKYNKSLIVISFEHALHDAQQTLLKVIEEPSLFTQFLIICPKSILIETIISRVQDISHDVKVDYSPHDELNKQAELFLTYSLTERLAFITTLESKQDNVLFLMSLLKCTSKHPEQYSLLRDALEKGLRHISLPSSSIKQIMETVAVAIY